LPSPSSPMKLAASMRFSKAEPALGKPCADPKLWCEAQDFALLVCSFAGGPSMAWNLAATCKSFHEAVCKAWGDLTRRFPCRLYVVGGLNNAFHEVDTAWRLNPADGVWEALPPIASPRAGAAAVAAGGKLYVLGGESSGHALRDAQRFDPLVGRWEELPPMLTGRIRAAAVFSGGYLYVLGGLDGSRPLSTAERYDPGSNTWEELPQMNCPRYACAGAPQPRGCVMAFGGELTDAGLNASIERYDPELGAWELLPTVRAPSCGAVVALTAAGRTAFTIGGLGLSGQALPVAERLALGPALAAAAPSQSSQIQLPNWGQVPPMLTPRHLASAAGFGSGVVAVGGKGPTFEAVSNVELFDPEAMSWESLPPLPSPRLRAAVVSGRL